MSEDRQAIKRELQDLGAWHQFETTDLPIGFLMLPDRLQIFYQQKGFERQEQNLLVRLQFESDKKYDRALDELHQRMQSADRIEHWPLNNTSK